MTKRDKSFGKEIACRINAFNKQANDSYFRSMLEEAGYWFQESLFNRSRYRHPNSPTAQGYLYVFRNENGVVVAKSTTGSDPFLKAGKPYNAFDLAVELFHGGDRRKAVKFLKRVGHPVPSGPHDVRPIRTPAGHDRRLEDLVKFAVDCEMSSPDAWAAIILSRREGRNATPQDFKEASDLLAAIKGEKISVTLNEPPAEEKQPQKQAEKTWSFIHSPTNELDLPRVLREAGAAGISVVAIKRESSNLMMCDSGERVFVKNNTKFFRDLDSDAFVLLDGAPWRGWTLIRKKPACYPMAIAEVRLILDQIDEESHKVTVTGLR